MPSKSLHILSFLLLIFALILTLFSPYSLAKEKNKFRAASLNEQANRLYDSREYAQAIPLALEALSILENAYGLEDPKLRPTLYLLYKCYNRTGDKVYAAHFYSRDLYIYEKNHSPLDTDANFKRNRLAKMYIELGEYDKAEPLLIKSLAVREKNLGKDHVNVAHALNSLAKLYYQMGVYSKAEPLYKRSLAIRENKLGNDHIDVGVGLNNLAALYFAQGDYYKAENLYLQALSIWRKKLGPDHPDLANILNNIGELYRAMGDYDRAESYFQQALAILQNKKGHSSDVFAATLNNLAELYRTLVYYGKAEELYKKALEIVAYRYGTANPKYATSLNNLGLLYYEVGDYRTAESIFLKVQSIWETTLGPLHPYVAINLNNQAMLYLDEGDYDRAELLFRRALSVTEQAFGKIHPQVATVLNNMGQLKEFQRQYIQAAQYYSEALNIYERVYGDEHPDVSLCLGNLAALKTGTGEIAVGFKLHVRALEIDQKLIESVMGFTSEDFKMKFLMTKMGSLNIFLSQVIQYMQDFPVAREKAFDVWLSRKGLILQAQRRFQKALAYSDDPKSVGIIQELASVRARLSKLVFEGPGKIDLEDYTKQKSELESQKEKLESELSRLSRTFALKQKIDNVQTVGLAKALPAGTVLLDFVRVAMFDVMAKENSEKWSPAHYLVFILHAGKGDHLTMIDLGAADKIDKAVNRFKRQIYDETDLERGGRRLSKTAQHLYSLVFEPIKADLGDIKVIFISPDSNLNLIPFEMLQTPEGRYLIEDYTFNYLSSGRDILAFGEIMEKSGKSLIIGDPDFDMNFINQNTDSDTNRGSLWKRSSDLSDLHFNRLAETKIEAEAIYMLLGKQNAELYLEKTATESILFKHVAPRYLHLATHGFFLNDQVINRLNNVRLNGMIPLTDDLSVKMESVVKIENPLLRSGLALAGANKTLKYGNTGQSDGILTAEKILSLRLRGTEMVVLSACETGLGEVRSGEGVFGLRRAFLQAGAQSIIMSMWQVPDKETQEVMVKYYKNIQAGMLKSQALRAAALAEKRVVAQKYGHSHPFYWGAFIFLGEP